jgi:hypothetical protein
MYASKPSNYIPLGGFVLPTKRTRSRAILQMQREGFQFQIACKTCDGLSITLEYTKDASTSTPIKCRHCGATRGTLGQLRQLSISGREDLFEA